MKQQEKWSKLSIISLIFIILSIFIFLLLFLLKYFLFYFILPIVFLFLIISFILSIISLIKIRKYNLKGRGMAITSLVLSIIFIILIVTSFIFLILAFSPTTLYSYEVPLKIDISSSNLKINPIKLYEKPDIFIYTKEDTDIFPENCSLNYLMFGLESSVPLLRFNNDGKYLGEYRGSHTYFPSSCIGYEGCSDLSQKLKIGNSGSSTYSLNLTEPNNKKKASKKLLEENKDHFYLRYSLIPFVSPSNSVRSLNSTGCITQFDKTGIILDKSYLEFKGGTRQTKNEEYRKIICVKKDSTLFSEEGCTLFEIKADITLDYQINMLEGKQTSRIVKISF